jgi:hypothetical protein
MMMQTATRTLMVMACLAAWQVTLRAAAQGVDIPASLGNDLPTNAPVEQMTPASSAPQAAAPSGPLPPQAQQDKEWLTAYMMAHKGYRLDHMDALEDSFNKMSPSQLATLRMFYEQKHAADTKSQALYQRAQENAVSMDEARVQRQRSAMNSINTEQSSAATLEDQRLKLMHEEASQNYQQEQALKSPSSGFPGYYGSPYAPIPAGGGYNYGY